jgi:hypothetical protein
MSARPEARMRQSFSLSFSFSKSVSLGWLGPESGLTVGAEAATLHFVKIMPFSRFNQNLALCGCLKVTVTMWLHTRKIAGGPAVGRSV